MADDSIFGNPVVNTPAEQTQETPAAATTQEQVANPAQTTATATDPYANLLASIQSEDGRQKYATTSDALNALNHAQKHIKDLTDEKKMLEQKVQEAANVEDIMKRVESQQAERETPSTPALDETAIAKMLESTLTKREQEILQKANAASVAKSLSEAYGEKAEEQYVSKATELGIGVETLNNLARTSPKAALAFFGVQHKPTSSSTVKTSVNTDAMDMNPVVKVDPLDRFKSTDSELIKKWRTAVNNIEG